MMRSEILALETSQEDIGNTLSLFFIHIFINIDGSNNKLGSAMEESKINKTSNNEWKRKCI